MFYLHYDEMQHTAVIYQLFFSIRNISAALSNHPDKPHSHADMLYA